MTKSYGTSGAVQLPEREYSGIVAGDTAIG